jgi:hypothetical protein
MLEPPHDTSADTTITETTIADNALFRRLIEINPTGTIKAKPYHNGSFVRFCDTAVALVEMLTPMNSNC